MKNILVIATLGVLTLTAYSAEAQTASSSESAGQASSSETSAQGSTKKTKRAKHSKTAANSSSKPGQYATEAQAKANCHGAAVVWVDSDHFSHYPGTREYGRKPGSYACEQ
jgi:hypothetical protein